MIVEFSTTLIMETKCQCKLENLGRTRQFMGSSTTPNNKLNNDY